MKVVRENIDFKRGEKPAVALGLGYQGLYGLFKELLDEFNISEIIFWARIDSHEEEKYNIEIYFEDGTSKDEIKKANEWIKKSNLHNFIREDYLFHANYLNYKILPEYRNLFWRFIKAKGQIFLGTDRLQPGMLQ